MLFADESTRLEFHKANTMMQMLAQAFESMCFHYAVQVKIMSVLDENSALVEAKLSDDVILDVLGRFNNLYGRVENDPSLHWLDEGEGDFLFIIHGDEGANLKNLN